MSPAPSAAEFAGWHWGFGVLAIGQLLLAIAILAWLPPERAPVHGSGTPLATMRALLHRAELRGAYAVGFSLLFALVGGFTYVTLRLAEPPFSLGPAALSAIFAVYLVSVFVTPLSGRLLNRYGHARVLMIAWAVAVAGLALSLLPNLPAMIGALTLFSGGLFIAQTAATSFVAEASGNARATSVGLYVLFYYLGGSAGGVVPAALWMHFGWPGVAALIVLIGAISVAIGSRSFRYALRPAANAPAPLPEAGGEAP
jgi:YNFM family putative membrane transporter